jgi:SAM-dependent methyltransferase
VSETIRQAVGRYYEGRLGQFGPTPRGVDWNSAESQTLRFDELLVLLAEGRHQDEPDVSLLDVGCGYGALLDHVNARGLTVDYRGFDVSEAMIDAARARHPASRDAFTSNASALEPAAFAVASGIFNVKLHHSVDEWRAYVFETIDSLHALSTRGFAFNMLSTYSDPEKRREDLFYADPCEMFDLCKRRFAAGVALLHDYPLFEFTVLVRK